MSNAIYLRKSRAEEQASNEEVLAKHKEALISLASRKGITITDMFEEVVSGESLVARPQMLKLLAGVRACEYDAVLCMDIDRLGRGGMADQGLILDTFRFSDTLIVTPDKTYDLSDESDEELTEFKAFMARREYKMIRKRMRRGLMATIEKGGYVANAPYGYAKCIINKTPSLEIVEDEAKFIRHIYNRYLVGIGCHIISDELNAMGSVPRRSNEWNRNTVRHILRNPTFMGKIAWNRVRHYRPGTHGNENNYVKYMPEDDWLMVDGLHPAIISEDAWHQAQTIRTERHIPSKATGHTQNPFAGLMICSVCGKKMQQLGKNLGEPYILCNRKGCQAGAKTEYIEAILVSSLEVILKQFELSRCDAIPTEQLQASTDLLEATKKEIEKLNARIPKLYAFLEDGVYDRETFRTRMDAVESQKKTLMKRLDELNRDIKSMKIKDVKRTCGHIKNVLSLYPTLTAEGKNELLKTLISKIEYTKAKKTKPHHFTLILTLKNL